MRKTRTKFKLVLYENCGGNRTEMAISFYLQNVYIEETCDHRSENHYLLILKRIRILPPVIIFDNPFNYPLNTKQFLGQLESSIFCPNLKLYYV